MATKPKFQAVKGTRDIQPPETALWNRVEQTAHEVFSTFGYGEIRVPIFEPTELFARAVGGETDIVSKEMYSFEDRPAGIPDARKFMELGDYVLAVEEGIRKETIPSTPSNRDSVRAFRSKLDEFVKVSTMLKTGFHSDGDP